jgi:predicted outer membrane repeat protein
MGRIAGSALAGAAVIGAVIAGGLGGTPVARAAAVVDVPCSVPELISAMTSQPGGETLSLAPGCVYVLTAGLPQVTQDLTIVGHGATLQRSYARGTAAFTIITVGSGALTVSELNFRHGDDAITVLDKGQLTVNGGTFSGNTGANGGAINSTSDYVPKVSNAAFSRNTATGYGGAISNHSLTGSSVSVDGCTFTGNKAAYGGAIYDFGFGQDIAFSTFRKNMAGTGGAIALFENLGGSLLNVVIEGNTASGDGGGVYVGEGSLLLDNSTISGNHADSLGGGLYLPEGRSSMTNTDIRNNSATNGGGIYNFDSIGVSITDSTISGNHASTDGGGVYDPRFGYADLTDSTVSGNHAAASGGGIYNVIGGIVSLTDSTVSGNRAIVNGGGIYNQGTATATGSKIIRNRAPGGGGGIYTFVGRGNYTTVTLSHSVVTGNKPDNCEPPGSIAGCAG